MRGFVGLALVAEPVMVLFKEVCENFEPLRTIGVFLSGEEEDTPENANTKAAE